MSDVSKLMNKNAIFFSAAVSANLYQCDSDR